ncbi:MAG: alpha/beta hydrolase [Steroidobacteraceae bacterium]
MTATVPHAEPLVIPGPAGAIEALLEQPQQPSGGFAVVCHPHPLHGGTMLNKVVHTLARAFQELGLATLRFNYRGVGASTGSYDNGRGETDDALAVIAHGQALWPGAAVSLGGFSFGAMVALRAAPRVAPVRLISVAPAVGRPEPVPLRRPACPWLIVQGDADEIVDCGQVQGFAAGFEPAPRLQILPGVDHFFHGRLHELHDAVIAFSREETR